MGRPSLVFRLSPEQQQLAESGYRLVPYLLRKWGKCVAEDEEARSRATVALMRSAYHYREELRENGNFGNYAARNIRLSIISYLTTTKHRRRVMAKSVSLCSLDFVRRNEAQSNKLDAFESIDMLKEAIAHLPPRLKQLVKLRAMEELSFREIADIMGESRQRVQTDYQTALRTMRQELVPLSA